jgi:hypothetical protein
MDHCSEIEKPGEIPPGDLKGNAQVMGDNQGPGKETAVK